MTTYAYFLKHFKRETKHAFTYFFDQVPGEAVIGGEFQADLSVNVRWRLAAAPHDQWEL